MSVVRLGEVCCQAASGCMYACLLCVCSCWRCIEGYDVWLGLGFVHLATVCGHAECMYGRLQSGF